MMPVPGFESHPPHQLKELAPRILCRHCEISHWSAAGGRPEAPASLPTITAKRAEPRANAGQQVVLVGQPLVHVARDGGLGLLIALPEEASATVRVGEIASSGPVTVTDDERRIPVRAETKVAVGSVTAVLVGGAY